MAVAAIAPPVPPAAHRRAFRPLDIATDRCKGCELCIAARRPQPAVARDARRSQKRIGDERVSCVVGLGGLLARRHLAGRPAVEVAIAELLSTKGPDAIAADIAALDAGWRAAQPVGGTLAARH